MDTSQVDMEMVNLESVIKEQKSVRMNGKGTLIVLIQEFKYIMTVVSVALLIERLEYGTSQQINQSEY